MKPHPLYLLFYFISWLYLVLLFGWLAAHLTVGERLVYLGLVNLVAVYLFLPLPFVLLAGLLLRSRGLLFGFGLGLIAFVWLWGDLFLPRLPGASAGGPALSVMTYNVLATHRFREPVLETIRAEDADIVCLQELNEDLARALQTEMAGVYPYQVLEPVNNATGIGVISKFPIRPTGERLPLQWIGGPQVLEVDWNGQAITLVNFHMYSTSRPSPPAYVERTMRLREDEARVLVELAARQARPVILAGDANSVTLNRSYQILTSELEDAWRQAGFGLGHTFPSRSTVTGSDRPKIGPWYVPPWLVRIDYIFHSGDWVTVEARLAQIDGVSDHRGVVAELRLTENGGMSRQR